MCPHSWRQVHEESLLGGYFPIGWECVRCGEFKSQSDLTPAGLNGPTIKEQVLLGPCGGRGQCSDGSTYKKQIIHADGSLEIVR